MEAAKFHNQLLYPLKHFFESFSFGDEGSATNCNQLAPKIAYEISDISKILANAIQAMLVKHGINFILETSMLLCLT